MILKRVKIETMIGNYTNCYIIEDEEKHEAMVIDPAGEPEKIIDILNLLQAKVKYIYLTHCHADHTAGLEELKKQTNDGLGFYTEDGIIDFEKFKIYFELAIELNEKILIPKNISIKEYFKEKRKNLC